MAIDDVWGMGAMAIVSYLRSSLFLVGLASGLMLGGLSLLLVA